jgi:6-phosphogluconate dehydrogenase
MTTPLCEIGMIGLGVMGRNLVLNMADHNHAVAGFDRDAAAVANLEKEIAARPIRCATSIPDFIRLLKTPRLVWMLVPAGPPVDAVIRDLLPFLVPGDVIIDGGNSHFTDTDLRFDALKLRGIHFLGVGISGGEFGARHGPSIMPGGEKQIYELIRPICEDIAARVHGEPCVTWLGPGSAGHYVKMIHNGIEYGLMNLIAETYDTLKRGLGMDDRKLNEVYEHWNASELSSYLMDITAKIFTVTDATTGQLLINDIRSDARQNGTGMWTSQEAMGLGEPTPTIDVAVSARCLSALDVERRQADMTLGRAIPQLSGERSVIIGHVRNALAAAMAITYAQGFALLEAGSRAHGFGLNCHAIVAVWREGCIIRSAFLEDLSAAFSHTTDLKNVLLDPGIAMMVRNNEPHLRAIVGMMGEIGIPASGHMSALAYLDGFRSTWLPSNLIQAQRDYFGSHTYERIDQKGVFHTRWTAE